MSGSASGGHSALKWSRAQVQHPTFNIQRLGVRCSMGNCRGTGWGETPSSPDFLSLGDKGSTESRPTGQVPVSDCPLRHARGNNRT